MSLPLFAQGDDDAARIKARYAPYANITGQSLLEQSRQNTSPDIWWRSPEEIRESGAHSGRSLDGLHLALDPGHIGGQWAEAEGRQFQIGAEDYPVREGELVLEVARLVRTKLVEMGAEVTLLRDDSEPLNPKPPEAYYAAALAKVAGPADGSWAAFGDYALALHRTMTRMSIVAGELVERSRLVNEDIRPDALVSLHINAAPWPKDEQGQVKYELVDSNHVHVLIFGCLSDGELSVPRQKKQLLTKLQNGSGPIERELGQTLGRSLGVAMSLPPSDYHGGNAVRLESSTPYLWARNLMLLRYVECPAILLEPYVANSKAAYPRIQAALKSRQLDQPLADDDILVEYADAVVEGILKTYGSKAD